MVLDVNSSIDVHSARKWDMDHTVAGKHLDQTRITVIVIVGVANNLTGNHQEMTGIITLKLKRTREIITEVVTTGGTGNKHIRTDFGSTMTQYF